MCYLESLLDGNMRVIEHGCGGSTLWFAVRVRSVTFLEDVSREWRAAVLSRNPNVCETVSYDGDYDLLLIDGMNAQRPKWIELSHRLVKPGGIVVVDNAERPQYRDALQRLADRCIMPTIITAWTPFGKRVDTVFYRLKGGVDWI